MCLSTIGKIIEIEGGFGKADMNGMIVEVNLSILDDVRIGDYVLIHTGFAIQKYDEAEALETIAMLKEALQPDADTEAI